MTTEAPPLVSQVSPVSSPRASWLGSMQSALAATLTTPEWWAMALAAFLVRGGILLILLPIVALPTPTGLITDLSPPVEALLLGTPSLVGTVLAAAVLYGLWPAMAAAVASTLAYDFFFTEPYHTLVIYSPADAVTVAVLFSVALVTSRLAGSTVVACEKTGRHGRMIEVDPIYVDVAIHRWEQYTGRPARLGGDGKTFAEVSEHRQPVHP